jgi:hypothetical protein
LRPEQLWWLLEDHAVDEAGIVSATAWRVLDGLQLARDKIS